MTYKGNYFKTLLTTIVAQRHNMPVSNVEVVSYFHFPDNTVQVTYNYKYRGKIKGDERRIGLLEVLEYQMNYSN